MGPCARPDTKRFVSGFLVKRQTYNQWTERPFDAPKVSLLRTHSLEGLRSVHYG